MNCPYITPRYENELIDEQIEAVGDGALYASTVFVYRNNEQTRAMFKEWWYHITRYHTIDQLSLDFCLKQSGCIFKVIQEHYLKTKYMTYVR